MAEALELKRQLSLDRLQALKDLGYTGANFVEDYLTPINTFLAKAGRYKINGVPWWQYVKDLPENQGKEFIDIVYELVEYYLVERKVKWLPTQ